MLKVNSRGLSYLRSLGFVFLEDRNQPGKEYGSSSPSLLLGGLDTSGGSVGKPSAGDHRLVSEELWPKAKSSYMSLVPFLLSLWFIREALKEVVGAESPLEARVRSTQANTIISSPFSTQVLTAAFQCARDIPHHSWSMTVTQPEVSRPVLSF